MRRWLFVLAAACVVWPGVQASGDRVLAATLGDTPTVPQTDLTPEGQPGALILAHGGSARWNEQVTQGVAQAALSLPTEVAFGMGMHADEVERIQRAIERLEAQGISRIVAVPLLVSSHSSVSRQLTYLLGLRQRGTWEGDIRPVRVRVPVVMTHALDDHPLVAEVLLDRAMALSDAPSQETVILVAHGPVADEDDLRWLAVMDRLAERVRVLGGFREVISTTLRDDAPEPVRQAATERLRSLVREHSADGQALVVPLLVATGGIEQELLRRLAGLEFVYAGEALLPHPKMAQWISSTVREATDRPSLAGEADPADSQ